MKNRSDRRKNGHYTGKKEALHVDLRVPFLICFAVGLILLGAGTAISHLNHPGLSAFWFGIGAIGVFVLTCAIVFGIYMFRHTRLREAVLAADHVNTEVYDMFRYVIDVPYAVIGMLVVYCLKNVTLLSWPHGLPELLACAATAVLHLWKHNNLISIGGGTVIYMILVQQVFVK